MTLFEVIVLFDGYCKVEENAMKANCTCTLIKGPVNVIVDTMTAWDGERIKVALGGHGLTCTDISYVICTHGHSDHIGCNYLFRDAKHIVGYSVSKGEIYDNFDFSGEDYVIAEGLRVTATPGHTLQDVSVLVETAGGLVAITGDLFEREEDLEDADIWKNAGSDSQELQEKNRARILGIADYIIPGHGGKFRNKFKLTKV